MHSLKYADLLTQFAKRLSLVLLPVACALLVGCSKEAPVAEIKYDNKPAVSDGMVHYTFLIHPLYNPQLLHEKYQPVMAYLGQKLPGTVFDLETANDYADFERKLKEQKAHFALPNPYHATLAQDWGYHVVARMGNDSVFKGVIIVRKDSPIKTPGDLKGKVVAYPAPTALAATMMPQLYLQKHGVDVENELKNIYVGTHNSSIMNAYLKQSAASATWPAAWKAFQQSNPTEAADLHILWETPTLIQNAIIVKNDVPATLSEKVTGLLTTLQDSDEGRQLLAGTDTQNWIASTNQDFDIVRTFLKEYNREVKKQK